MDDKPPGAESSRRSPTVDPIIALATFPTAGHPGIPFVMRDDISQMRPGVHHRDPLVGESLKIDRIECEAVILGATRPDRGTPPGAKRSLRTPATSRTEGGRENPFEIPK